MNSLRRSAVILVGFASFSRAELPVLDEQPFIGKFLAYEDRKMAFAMTKTLSAEIELPEGKGKQMPHGMAPVINFRIEELMTDGRTVSRQINADSLATEQPAAMNFQKTTVRGKTTGDAEFEVVTEFSRGALMFGGRIISPGTLKGPLSLLIAVRVGDPYKHVPADERSDKDFARKIRRDFVELTTLDRKREKLLLLEAQELSNLMGSQVVMEFDAWKGRGLQVNASPNSTLSFKNSGSPLLEGFEIIWKADAAKDPNGEARLALTPR